MTEGTQQSVDECIDEFVLSEEPLRVRVVQAGYARTDEHGVYHANGSVTRVQLRDLDMLVDCGKPSEKLPGCLSTVNTILITHWHSDHCGRLVDFPDAKVFDEASALNAEITRRGLINLNAQSLNGHSTRDNVLLVGRPGDDPVVICGDIFEDEADFHSVDPLGPASTDEGAHRAAREWIRGLHPSMVIPGHGPAFRVHGPRRVGTVQVKQLVRSFFTHQCSQWVVWGQGRVILINAADQTLPPSVVTDVVILKPRPLSVRHLGTYGQSRVFMTGGVFRPPDIYEDEDKPVHPIPGAVHVEETGNGALRVRIFAPGARDVVIE